MQVEQVNIMPDDGGPAFKDQMRSVVPSAQKHQQPEAEVPIATVVPHDEAEEQQRQLQGAENKPREDGDFCLDRQKKPSRAFWIAGLLIVLGIGGMLGGLCGAGKCKASGQDFRSATFLPTTSPVQQTQKPTNVSSELDLTGIWSYAGDRNINIVQVGSQVTATQDSGEWSSATGVIDGDSLTMTFDNGAVFEAIISDNGNTISFPDNGTFWTRSLAGTWSFAGYPGIQIVQSGTQISATLETGAWSTATGVIDGNRLTMTFDNGVGSVALISHDGNMLNFDNGTFWTRV